MRVAVRGIPELDNVNQTLVVPTEFEDVQREFPIFIRKDDRGEYVAVALLGFDKGENLFLEGGQWISNYVPAVHRRGPFFLGPKKTDQAGESSAALAVHVDLDDPRVGAEGGEPLFKEHGGNSAYLDHVTRTLGVIRDGLAAAPQMFAMLDELGLIQPIEVEVQLDDGKSYRLPSFFTVGADQFQALGGAQLERLNRSGLLAATIFIRSSLPNINRLIDLKKRAMREAA